MRSDSSTFTEHARRAQIVAGAMRVIAEGGYAQASVARIADHIGVAKSVVLYHFKTKNDIIEAVVGAVFGTAAAQMAPAIAAATSPADRLAAYIRSNVAFINQNPVAATAMLEIVTGFRTADGLRLDQAATAAPPPEAVELVALDPESIFADGVRSGQFRPMSPVFMKNALRAALDGAVWELARDPGYDVLGYGEELVTTFDLATRSS
ncbi:TetR/AcrR family transcriptional regulator [Aldersonia sp. NBC_00410]|uniref:TetR/AcrR family transcriptional regulator n=1 Tax=Aldersonia sp. NBC_00410 TaxID=2975954 RepID=UPI00225656F3|nr:TetR/AcrR family transcriptional regulator [Aldersonia sp. NBC_00410]MCX5044903.1 TetR/AcrR family transcriptional regulator [Aldersonia sp. NBC_00410]